MGAAQTQTVVDPENPSESRPDGRRARRDRGRAAVIDAAFELIMQGEYPPSLDRIAAASGVSEASIFRYFDGVADLQDQAVTQFLDRYAHLAEIADPGIGERSSRISALVRARVDFYEQTASILAAGRARAHREGREDAIRRGRRFRVEWVRRQFAPELEPVSATRAADLVGAIDTLTSPEAWDALREHHGRTKEQIRRSWIRSVAAIIEAWENPA